MITRWWTPEGGRIDLIHLEDHGWRLLVRHPASGVVITEIALGSEVPHDDLTAALEAVGAVPELLPRATDENLAGTGSGPGSPGPTADPSAPTP
jgi:hypothetical protein